MGRSQEEEEGENLAQGQREEEVGLEGRLMRWAWRWTEMNLGTGGPAKFRTFLSSDFLVKRR